MTTETISRHLWIHESSRSDLYEHGMLRVFERGEGAWMIDERGDRYLDLCSSMWQAALGHGRDDIVAAYRPASIGDRLSRAHRVHHPRTRRASRADGPLRSRRPVTGVPDELRLRGHRDGHQARPSDTIACGATTIATSSSRATARTTEPAWEAPPSGPAAPRQPVLPVAAGHGEHHAADRPQRPRGG